MWMIWYTQPDAGEKGGKSTTPILLFSFFMLGSMFNLILTYIYHILYSWSGDGTAPKGLHLQSDSVVRSNQMQRESSGVDEWNRVPCMNSRQS